MPIEVTCPNNMVVVESREVEPVFVVVGVEGSQGIVIVAVVIYVEYGDAEIIVLETDGCDVVASDTSQWVPSVGVETCTYVPR